MPGLYDIGQEITLQTLATDVNDANVDDGTVVCTVTSLKDGAHTNPTVSHAATGDYRATFTPSVDGDHWYGFEGDKGAGEGFFSVRKKRARQ